MVTSQQNSHLAKNMTIIFVCRRINSSPFMHQSGSHEDHMP